MNRKYTPGLAEDNSLPFGFMLTFQIRRLAWKKGSHLERPCYTTGKDLPLANQQDPSSNTVFSLARGGEVNTLWLLISQRMPSALSYSVLARRRWASAREREKAKLEVIRWFENEHQLIPLFCECFSYFLSTLWCIVSIEMSMFLLSHYLLEQNQSCQVFKIPFPCVWIILILLPFPEETKWVYGRSLSIFLSK